MCFQDARLFPHLAVRDNLRYGERRARDRTRQLLFDDVVALLGLAPLLAGAGLPACRAGNGSVSRSAGRCWRSRACYCSMSPWRASMWRDAASCCRIWKTCAIIPPADGVRQPSV